MRTVLICILASLLFSDAALPAIAEQCPSTDPAPARPSIAWDAIGKAAGAQSQGDALTISATDHGALLHCAFQRMDGYVTAGGLWLASTTTNSHGERFRLAATGLGRSGEQNVLSLCSTGQVQVMDGTVRWERPGLTEEYSVSMDGLRQDYVIEQRPPGHGELRLELALSGARAEPADYGAKIILEESHRALAYSRLRVVDATGRALAAKMEVVSASRLAVQMNDAGASYPVRIDPTFSDANWVSLGSYPGADDIVYTMVEDKNAGTVYIGGQFRAVGTTAAVGIAQWNGSTWL